jgi:hypothetical protein
MDIASLNKLTVPQLKKELRDRGLPVGGVKAELVSRLHSSLCRQQQQQQQLQQQQQQQQQVFLNPNFTNNYVYQATTIPFVNPIVNTPPQIPARVTTKTMDLFLGLVDPRDHFGSLVNGGMYGEFDNIHHEGMEWGFYCTKSMDYQIWTTVYLKCIKKIKQGNEKKRVLDESIPAVEAVVEFPNGKKVKGVLNIVNNHRLNIINNAGHQELIKTFGARDKNHVSNVKVTLRTLSEMEVKQMELPQKKQKSKDKEDEVYRADWGVYDQLDSDDENRSDYYSSSDYSSDSELE